ncbi:MAG: undecaprenyldiphospho-muramoylpentapeptide beta-N-acetylglucosaminyltransferase [Candidatus Zixiibacteriota bacterium]
MKQLKVIFAGGGTGGHLFPALAIADGLKKRIEPEIKADFRFFGTRNGLEYRMKEKLGYPLSLITVRGISRSGILKNIIFPFLLLGAVLKSLFIILKFGPDIIIGTGGYVMGPVMLAAIALNKRTAIQEQNSYPGLTTRKLAGKVDKVFLGFGVARKYLDKLAETVETGNPVKDVIGKYDRQKARQELGINENEKVILILGGSQGATSINQNILDNMKTVPENYRLLWQAGELNYNEIKNGLDEKQLTQCILFPFTNEIEKYYAAADIAIARSGALTMAELEIAGLPSILIPYPYAAEDHQRINAEYFVENKVALSFDDKLLKEYNMIAVAVDLCESGQREVMVEALANLKNRKDKPAVEMIVDEILAQVDIKGSDS